MKSQTLEAYLSTRLVLSIIVVIFTITVVGSQSILSIANSFAAILPDSSDGNNSNDITFTPPNG
jgi:hypothetical protein